MSTHKHIDRICAAAAVLSLLLALLFLNGEALGLQPASQAMGYEAKLFDTSRVHTIEIIMDDWDGFLETCENEEYAVCSVVIDNEACKNVGLRAKGNTSLSTVSQMGSDRYSFKIEFDQYDSGKTYYGLDKLCLNNLIQDNTMMKDYLTYRLMGGFGVNAPLCSYAYLTVNGQDWGLYLAVEGVEDAFLQRNYGRDHGQLYKPDSMSFGGGRGNGREFDMEEFMNRDDEGQDAPQTGGTPPEGFDPSPFGRQGDNVPPAGMPDGFGGQFPGGGSAGEAPPEGFDPAEGFTGGGFAFGGMGSGDVKLQYSDDDPDSYANIFNSAKTEISQTDQARLIQALKALGEGDVDNSLDIDQVLRYFVVHNFVVNGDSYTGMMVHNYYLYEEDGRLAMLPWDYNLAFGTFQGGDASTAVNDPIDTPLSVTGNGDRPMADWISSSQTYTALYHQYFEEFLSRVDPAALIAEAYGLIAPYVERDPTKFCTYGEFETGVEALETFCRLRVESVSRQLDRTIPSTDEGQSADGSALVDASTLNLSDMGTMGGAGGPGEGGRFPAGGFGGVPAFDSAGSTSGPVPSEGGDGQQARPQAPGDLEPSFFGQDGKGGPQPSAGREPGAAGPDAASALIWLAVSILVLVLGLIAAFQFKRHGDVRRGRPSRRPASRASLR